MDDDFLTGFRKAPRPEFSKKLYERIDEPMNVKPTWRRTLTRWSPALALATVLVAAVLLFSFSPAQALAQGFLDLFRVKHFTAVTVDPARLAQLQSGNIDLKSMLADNIQTVKEPGEPKVVANPQAAEAEVGFKVLVPSQLPATGRLAETRVTEEGIVRITADTAKAQAVLDALGIDDVKVPQALNGQTITLTSPRAVVMRYTLARGDVMFMQSPSPEIELPKGVDLAQFGEIALRVAGMSKSDAHNMAQTIDWHSTLLVPVPANAASFRQVDVRGTQGLFITTHGNGGFNFGDKPGSVNRSNDSNPGRQTSILLWSKNNMVYALSGDVASENLLELANSVK